MDSLDQLSELVGFFSYSREDDEAFQSSLSALRSAIARDLSAQLGRTKKTFRLWQDQEAIAPGKLWQPAIATAIEQSVFFIPIITPRAVGSKYCKFEFESFLARERTLGRDDLIFPIHYIRVPALEDEAEWRDDPVLSVVARRQYVDWRSYRHQPVDGSAFGQAIDRFCGKIAETLRERWASPGERRQLDPETKNRAEEEARRRDVAGRKRETRAPLATVAAPVDARENAANIGPLTAAQERALRAGDSFKEGADCPEMIVLPPGRFMMGSSARNGDDDERPQHRVTIAKPFAVARFALTFDEWDAGAVNGGCRSDVSDNGWGRGRRPVINVSWDDAKVYVKWLSRITRRDYRLLSEAEFEYAARAGSETTYPWGPDIKLNGRPMANWGGKQTAPVDSFSPNGFGLYQMVGNVWEWTEDCWNPNYEGAPADGSAWTNGDCSRRVVRGGSWDTNPGNLRSACRSRYYSDLRSGLGFRVARTLSP